MKKLNTITIIIFFISVLTNAQSSMDTVKFNLSQVEQIFLANNLQLLAAKFNIKASKALETQAALWNNPVFSVEQNIYNQYTGKYFDFTSNGNTDYNIDQLITLAGKKSKQLKLANINSKISENSFFDLIRTLKYELRKAFLQLYNQQKSLKFYDDTIPILQKTINIAENGYEKKFVLLSEVIRLKTLLLSLQNDQLNLQNKISETTNQLFLFLHFDLKQNKYFIPQVELEKTDQETIDKYHLDDVIRIAQESRPDYLSTKLNQDYEEENLSLQKALAIPDITLGFRYSRAGGYIPNYYALALQVELPLFNRNQGNIEASEFNLQANILTSQHYLLSITNDVKTALDKASSIDHFYRSIDKKFTAEYKSLLEATTNSYQKRNIGIIEFTDFIESYRNSMVQINQLQVDRLTAFEDLNYAAGKTLLNN